MSEEKCIFNKSADENTEELSSVCFKISSDVQFKDVPTTGEEYLLKVIKERQNCSIITKSMRDFTKYAKNQSYFLEEVPHAKVPDKFRPTIEWQNIQVADFSDIRMYISRLHAKKSLWPSEIKKVDIENTLRGWKSFFTTNDPTLSCVLGLPSSVQEKGLESLIKIIGEIKRGSSIDHKIGQWIYAFLACTPQPLLSETTSTLRDLARKCAEVRSNINPEDENSTFLVAPLNIFICIVGRYFRQYDLAD